MTFEELSKHHAYDLMVTTDSTKDVDSVLEKWENDEHHDDVVLWDVFEHKRPHELLEIFETFKYSLENFARYVERKGL